MLRCVNLKRVRPERNNVTALTLELHRLRVILSISEFEMLIDARRRAGRNR